MLGLKLGSLAWSVLGAVAFAAVIFAIGYSAGTKAEQRRSDPKAAALCEAADSTWPEVDANGRALPRAKWGKACLAAIQGLAKFKHDVLAQQTKILEQHAADEAQKAAADAAAAARQASELKAAQQQMEATNGKVQNDRAGADWFRELNRVGGLREPGKAAAGSHVPAADRSPPY